MPKHPHTSSHSEDTPDIRSAFFDVEEKLAKHGMVKRISVAKKATAQKTPLSVKHMKRTLLPTMARQLHSKEKQSTIKTEKKLGHIPNNLPLGSKHIRITTEASATKQSPYVTNLKNKGRHTSLDTSAEFLQNRSTKRDTIHRSRGAASERFLKNIFNIFSYGALSVGGGMVRGFETLGRRSYSLSHLLLRLRPTPPPAWKKNLAAFFTLGLLLTLPFHGMIFYNNTLIKKNQVMASGSEGAESLVTAAAHLSNDPAEALGNFENSLRQFSEAESTLREDNALLLEVVKILPFGSNEVKMGEALLKAGKNMALAGEVLARNLVNTATEDIHFTQKIALLAQKTKEILPLLTESSEAVQGVNENILPDTHRARFAELKKKLPVLVAHLHTLSSFSDALLEVLGHNSTKRYLVFFQNNAELRPTGGFLGSFALLDIDRGTIKNMEIPGGGTYDMNGGLKEFVLAPEPLHLVNTRWQLQDSNWFPDFPTSAQKMMWFYEKSGGPTVDGVITLTPNVVEALLRLTGPIDLTEKYGAVIDEKNFWEVVQTEAEKKYDVTRESKKIIGELTPLLLQKILTSDDKDFLGTLDIINRSLAEKHILFYMKDADLETKITQLGWGGEIKQSPEDYLAVFDTNISGGKTDRHIVTDTHLLTRVAEDGSLINTLTITKTHTAKRHTPLTGIKNTSYMRVYVPKGSELIEARGFLKPPKELFETLSLPLEPDALLASTEQNPTTDEASGTRITEEFGKTVFGNWIEIEPESTTVVNITYKLPFTLQKTAPPQPAFLAYLFPEKPRAMLTLLAQKQPGTTTNFSHALSLPPSYSLTWSSEENTPEQNKKLYEYPTSLATDQAFAYIFQ